MTDHPAGADFQVSEYYIKNQILRVPGGGFMGCGVACAYNSVPALPMARVN